MKKIITVLLIFALFMGVPFIQSENAQAKANNKKAKAMKAYKEFLANDEVELEGSKYKVSEFEFAIKDLNHDGVPEVILSAMNSGESVQGNIMYIVFTYYKSGVKKLIDIYNGHIEAYKKGDIFIYDCLRQGLYTRFVYKIVKGELRRVAYYQDDEQWIYSEGKGKQYFINDKEVSEKKYNKFLKKRTKSTNKKGETLDKFYPVTKSNIKKYCR